ncbi:hypothetical protein [Pseudomonas sp. Leaf58]|uniref:hypothetical protein n=1 Tax=Pseudomonas sp. Leaf58 TaxID=1736226 RepID=UPI0013C48323|nr:hypothetical protein [Pseudomonas sp. Leaf58]
MACSLSSLLTRLGALLAIALPLATVRLLSTLSALSRLAIRALTLTWLTLTWLTLTWLTLTWLTLTCLTLTWLTLTWLTLTCLTLTWLTLTWLTLTWLTLTWLTLTWLTLTWLTLTCLTLTWLTLTWLTLTWLTLTWLTLTWLTLTWLTLTWLPFALPWIGAFIPRLVTIFGAVVLTLLRLVVTTLHLWLRILGNFVDVFVGGFAHGLVQLAQVVFLGGRLGLTVNLAGDALHFLAHVFLEVLHELLVQLLIGFRERVVGVRAWLLRRLVVETAGLLVGIGHAVLLERVVVGAINFTKVIPHGEAIIVLEQRTKLLALGIEVFVDTEFFLQALTFFTNNTHTVDHD